MKINKISSLIFLLFLFGCNTIPTPLPIQTQDAVTLDFTPVPSNTPQAMITAQPLINASPAFLPTPTAAMQSSQGSIDAYKKSLAAEENLGGNLSCKNGSGEITENYTSCTSFENLKEHGCFGLTTFDMMQEYNYAIICEEKVILKQASVAVISYFDLDTNDWWKSIPAEIIPMRSGIYTKELWEEQKSQLEKMVAGKSLGDLNFVKLSASSRTLDAVLSSEESTCGTINDEFHLEVVLLADLDGDGKAELLLQGVRSNQSESCFLGSGNDLGGGFIAIINKDSPTATPSIITFPNTEQP